MQAMSAERTGSVSGGSVSGKSAVQTVVSDSPNPLECASVITLPASFLVTTEPSLRVGSFHLQMLGQPATINTDNECNDVSEILADILKRYDLLLIMEPRTNGETNIDRLIKHLNTVDRESPFDFEENESLCSAHNVQEHYCFFYRVQRLSVIDVHCYGNSPLSQTGWKSSSGSYNLPEETCPLPGQSLRSQSDGSDHSIGSHKKDVPDNSSDSLKETGPNHSICSLRKDGPDQIPDSNRRGRPDCGFDRMQDRSSHSRCDDNTTTNNKVSNSRHYHPDPALPSLAGPSAAQGDVTATQGDVITSWSAVENKWSSIESKWSTAENKRSAVESNCSAVDNKVSWNAVGVLSSFPRESTSGSSTVGRGEGEEKGTAWNVERQHRHESRNYDVDGGSQGEDEANKEEYEGEKRSIGALSTCVGLRCHKDIGCMESKPDDRRDAGRRKKQTLHQMTAPVPALARPNSTCTSDSIHSLPTPDTGQVLDVAKSYQDNQPLGDLGFQIRPDFGQNDQGQGRQQVTQNDHNQSRQNVCHGGEKIQFRHLATTHIRRSACCPKDVTKESGQLDRNQQNNPMLDDDDSSTVDSTFDDQKDEDSTVIDLEGSEVDFEESNIDDGDGDDDESSSSDTLVDEPDRSIRFSKRTSVMYTPNRFQRLSIKETHRKPRKLCCCFLPMGPTTDFTAEFTEALKGGEDNETDEAEPQPQSLSAAPPAQHSLPPFPLQSPQTAQRPPSQITVSIPPSAAGTSLAGQQRNQNAVYSRCATSSALPAHCISTICSGCSTCQRCGGYSRAWKFGVNSYVMAKSGASGEITADPGLLTVREECGKPGSDLGFTGTSCGRPCSYRRWSDPGLTSKSSSKDINDDKDGNKYSQENKDDVNNKYNKEIKVERDVKNQRDVACTRMQAKTRAIEKELLTCTRYNRKLQATGHDGHSLPEDSQVKEMPVGTVTPGSRLHAVSPNQLTTSPHCCNSLTHHHILSPHHYTSSPHGKRLLLHRGNPTRQQSSLDTKRKIHFKTMNMENGTTCLAADANSNADTDPTSSPKNFHFTPDQSSLGALEEVGEAYCNTNSLDQVFVRDCFAVFFMSPTTEVSKFAVLALHTDPSDARKELWAMQQVYDITCTNWDVMDVFVMGDFKTDDSEMSDRHWRSVVLKSDRRFTHLLNPSFYPVLSSSDRNYDRMVVVGRQLNKSFLLSSPCVFQFDQALGLTDKEAALVSDHYPIQIGLAGRATSALQANVHIRPGVVLVQKDPLPAAAEQTLLKYSKPSKQDIERFVVSVHVDEASKKRIEIHVTRNNVKNVAEYLAAFRQTFPSILSDATIDTAVGITSCGWMTDRAGQEDKYDINVVVSLDRPCVCRVHIICYREGLMTSFIVT